MKKKSIAIICLLLIVVMAVGGVLAFMTDESRTVNTFSVGNVSLELTETKVDNYGNAVTKKGKVVRTEDGTGNHYHLIPGKSYIKDPMVTVKGGSEMAYVRMILTVTNVKVLDEIIAANGMAGYSDFFKGWNDEWIYHDYTWDEEADTISFEFRYEKPVGGYDLQGKEKMDNDLEPLFTELYIPGSVTTEQLAKLCGDFDGDGQTDEGKSPIEVTVVAQAIQTAGFAPEDTTDMTEEEIAAASEDAAWKAFDEQVNSDNVTEPDDEDDVDEDEKDDEDDKDDKENADNKKTEEKF